MFQKFDPPVSRRLKTYVLAQFAVSVVAALYVADLFAKDGAGAVVIPCLLLWAQLYTIGLLTGLSAQPLGLRSRSDPSPEINLISDFGSE